ncbi:MAG: hypothetical protein L6311_09310 [Cellulomonas sp.]|nr:hypothetical protein [Cellulomonas sp.]
MTGSPAQNAATGDCAPSTQPRPATRALRKALGLVGEFVVELVLSLLSLGLFLAVAAVAVWGWGQQPVVTAGGAALVVALLAYGVWVVMPARRRHPRGPLARVAVGLLKAMGMWLVYLVQWLGAA